MGTGEEDRIPFLGDPEEVGVDLVVGEVTLVVGIGAFHRQGGTRLLLVEVVGVIGVVVAEVTMTGGLCHVLEAHPEGKTPGMIEDLVLFVCVLLCYPFRIVALISTCRFVLLILRVIVRVYSSWYPVNE